MNRGRLIFSLAVIFLFAILLSGCTTVTRSAPSDKGQLLRTDRIVVLPLFSVTEKTYSNGVQKYGNVLLFINWRVWKDKAQPAATLEVAAPTDAPRETAAD